MPKGRRTERGPLPAKYQLKEMSSDSYPKWTEQNVVHSDGTLIISHGELAGGSDYTKKMAEKHDKPWLHVDARKTSGEAAVQIIRAWINGNEIAVLNIAGPRASRPGTHSGSFTSGPVAGFTFGNENRDWHGTVSPDGKTIILNGGLPDIITTVDSPEGLVCNASLVLIWQHDIDHKR